MQIAVGLGGKARYHGLYATRGKVVGDDGLEEVVAGLGIHGAFDSQKRGIIAPDVRRLQLYSGRAHGSSGAEGRASSPRPAASGKSVAAKCEVMPNTHRVFYSQAKVRIIALSFFNGVVRLPNKAAYLQWLSLKQPLATSP